MLRIITTADTEIMATAAAVERLPVGFPEVRCANPVGRGDHEQLIDEMLAGARVVVCRILGGRRGWWPGFDVLRTRCRERGVALIALGGEAEPDAEMMALSLAPTQRPIVNWAFPTSLGCLRGTSSSLRLHVAARPSWSSVKRRSV